MSIALRNKQLLALIVLVVLTVFAIASVVLGVVLHISVWHMMAQMMPNYLYPGH